MSHLPKPTLSFLYSQVFPLRKRLRFVMPLYVCFLSSWVPLCDGPTWLLSIYSLPMALPVKFLFLFQGCTFFKYREKSSSPCTPYNSSTLLLVPVSMVSSVPALSSVSASFLVVPKNGVISNTLFLPPKTLSYLTAHWNPSAGRLGKHSKAQVVGCPLLCLFCREGRWKEKVLL